MADAADYADGAIEQHLAQALRALPAGNPGQCALECEDCGDAIPEKRRLALLGRGCTRCIDCQSLADKRGGAGMRKSIERWAAIDPKLVAQASPAHIAYLVADAQADIAELAGCKAAPAVRLELVVGGTWPGLHIRKWDNLAGLAAGVHELYTRHVHGAAVELLPPDLIKQARVVFEGCQDGLDAIEYIVALHEAALISGFVPVCIDSEGGSHD